MVEVLRERRLASRQADEAIAQVPPADERIYILGLPAVALGPTPRRPGNIRYIDFVDVNVGPFFQTFEQQSASVVQNGMPVAHQQGVKVELQQFAQAQGSLGRIGELGVG